MKNYYVVLLALSILGCSSMQADPMPTAEQTYDLQDTDGDGVINARDFCVNTPKGAVIDNTGCPTLETHTKQNQLHILFANDDDTVSSAFLAQIKQMAGFLKQYPDTYITLQGYASPAGNPSYNLKLSERRAKNVRNVLMANGVEAQRIHLVGHGEWKPVMDEQQHVIDTLSRRVTAKVLGMNSEIKKQWTIFDERPE